MTPCDCGACDACDEFDFDQHDDGGDADPCWCDACRRVRARTAREVRPIAGGIVGWALDAIGLRIDQ